MEQEQEQACKRVLACTQALEPQLACKLAWLVEEAGTLELLVVHTLALELVAADKYELEDDQHILCEELVVAVVVDCKMEPVLEEAHCKSA